MDQGAEEPARLTGDEIRKLICDITDQRISGEIDLLGEHFAPDVVVHCNCTKEGLFTDGMLRGRDEFLNNLRE